MNYNYKSQSDRELLSVRENMGSLRYEAQQELIETLLERGLSSPSVEADVLRKQDVVASLGYLKEMGYDVVEINDGTRITRNWVSQLIDFAGSILGVLFIFMGAKGVVELWMHFNSDDPFDLTLIFVNGFLTLLGFYGIKMLSGFSRFLDNLGLEFFYQNQTVLLKKRIDFKIETFKGTPQDVVVSALENELVLTFQDIPVMLGNPNSKLQRLTIEAVKSNIENMSE